MNETLTANPGPRTYLNEISTRWSLVNDPVQFVMRYAPAIEKYMTALIDNPADAEDACQDFVVKVLVRGFAHASPDRGQFRKYLKAAVRNAALMHYRSRQSERNMQARYSQTLIEHQCTSDADEQWSAAWRQCVLKRAWNRLHNQQRRGGSLCYTVLRVTADHPDEDSASLATRVAEITGNPLRPDAFRQQLHRARRRFSELLIEEVAQTLEPGSDTSLEQELAETGLLEYVRDYLIRQDLA